MPDQRCPRRFKEDIMVDGEGARVFHAAEIEPIDRGNGVVSYPITSEAAGARHLLTGMTVLPSGAEIPWHTHDEEECIVVLQGAGSFDTEQGRTPLVPFDATLVSAGIAHRFSNLGDEPLRILWVYPTLDTRRTLLGESQARGHLDRYDPT
jgi:quercetin dioxygenase-like cupin family protein